MKKIILLSALAFTTILGACQKDKVKNSDQIPANMPRTEVPAALKGVWMFGNFSMTEYWSQDPGTYVGNAVQFAIAFKFNTDGTYEQYFTSSAVTSGVSTYQQSVTKGTVEIDPVSKLIKTHPYKAHYKRTRGNQVLEERDLLQSELSGTTSYSFESGTEANDVKAIYLTMQGTSEPLTFLQKF